MESPWKYKELTPALWFHLIDSDIAWHKQRHKACCSKQDFCARAAEEVKKCGVYIHQEPMVRRGARGTPLSIWRDIKNQQTRQFCVAESSGEREREIDCGCSLVEAAWAFALVSFCESCRGCLSEPTGVGFSNQSPILYNVRVVDLYRTQDIFWYIRSYCTTRCSELLLVGHTFGLEGFQRRQGPSRETHHEVKSKFSYVN